MTTLTRRQRQVYEFIRTHLRSLGYPPSVREIGEALGINSPNGVAGHLKQLERRGWIKRDPTTARGIRLLGEKCCPTCGREFSGVGEHADM